MRIQSVCSALGLLVVALALAGCSADDPAATAIDTNQNPVTFAALGNSLTAGFINGGLIQGGQDGSFSRLLASQAGWGFVAQPTVLWPGIGSTSGRSALYVDLTGAITSYEVLNPFPLLANATHPVPYNNMGVPGATTADVLTAIDAGTSQSGRNSFFDLILRNSRLRPGDTNQFDQVRALHPKAMTLWIGCNDILGGAAGGNPVVASDGNITPFEDWEILFDAVLDSVETIGADIVAVATIPGITSAAYFTTVPLGFPVSEFETIPWLTDEEDVAYILLPIGSSLDNSYLPAPYGLGAASIPGTMTLTTAEADVVGSTIDAYNDHIEEEAALRGWALVDIAAVLEELSTDTADVNRLFGWSASGQNVNSAFSLDGIHPSEKGYGVIANAFIAAINATYETDIPALDPGSITNATGFEAIESGFVPPHGKLGAGPIFSESGRKTLSGLPTLLGNGR